MKPKLFLTVTLLIAAACAPLRADDTAQRTAAVEDLLTTMHANEMMTNILARQREAMSKMASSFMPKDTPPEAAKKFQEEFPKMMDTVYKQLTWESLKPDMVQIYSDVFTLDEIKGLSDFYKTPLGQALLKKTPEISARSMQMMQKRMPAIMAEVQKSVKEMVEKSQEHAKPAASPAASAK